MWLKMGLSGYFFFFIGKTHKKTNVRMSISFSYLGVNSFNTRDEIAEFANNVALDETFNIFGKFADKKFVVCLFGS